METYRDMLLTKSNAWSYEAEERLIDWRRPLGIYKYNRNDILKTVILGVRMLPDHKKNIKKLSIQLIVCREQVFKYLKLSRIKHVLELKFQIILES